MCEYVKVYSDRIVKISLFSIREGPMQTTVTKAMRDNNNSYEGISLTSSDSQSQTIMSSRVKLLDRLIESMAHRFQDVSVGVLCATKLVNFANWPESGDAAAGVFTLSTTAQVQGHDNHILILRNQICIMLDVM